MASIMHTEAGIMLMAEEFDLLRNISVLRIMVALAKHGPMTKKELLRAGLGKPYKISNLLRFLVDEGKVSMAKRVHRPHPRKPVKRIFQYFITDEFMIAALTECIDMLERTHQAYAEGFARLSGELRPLF